MKGKITAVLFIVVFLLVVAVVCTFLSGWNKTDAEPADTPTPEETGAAFIITPEESPAVQTQSPTSNTPTPVQTPVPTSAVVTPSPTPVQTTAPVYTPSSLGSGTFASETGANINIRAAWTAETISSSQIEVTVTVSLDSYSINLRAVPNSVNVNFGGQYVSLDAPAIEYDGTAAINTVLATKTFTVDLAQGQSDTYALNVEWHFGGTYGGVELPVIECGGSVSLSR